LANTHVVTNFALKSQIDDWREAHLRPAPVVAEQITTGAPEAEIDEGWQQARRRG
jgi:hypothetical protein